MSEPTFYIASRVHHAERWKQFRDAGAPIISTWIDEAGEGQTASMGMLWQRIVDEINRCSALVLYATPDDFPLKGALVEAGIAMGLGRKVIVVLPGVEFEKPSMRPIGSWIMHPEVYIGCDIRRILLSLDGEKTKTKETT